MTWAHRGPSGGLMAQINRPVQRAANAQPHVQAFHPMLSYAAGLRKAVAARMSPCYPILSNPIISYAAGVRTSR